MYRTETIEKLCEAFPQVGPVKMFFTGALQKYEDQAASKGRLTIGAEVEIRWRHYFPELWDKYLSEKPYHMLDRQAQYDLSEECHEQELILLPMLKKTEECGIPKGKDKYYEFAFAPAYNPYTLATEIEILRKLWLIPPENKHSLHITIGGLGHSIDTGLMLMALEILGYTSKERIIEVATPDKAVTWARKGRAGLRERSAAELSLGATKGIELRTLELPDNQRKIEHLFSRASMMANAIAGDPDSSAYMAWLNIVDELHQIGERHKIDTYTNWGRPYDNPDVWLDFADKLESINTIRLKELVDAL